MTAMDGGAEARYRQYRDMIEAWLAGRLAPAGDGADGLRQVMAYSLLAGGKRVRPVLCLEFARVCGLEPERALPAACALEMLHTYSLIHDDLPCMDDDDMRRGRPTSHKKFGETAAVLAGDCLQAEAFAAVCDAPIGEAERSRCCGVLSRAAGAEGICGGQYMDLGAGPDSAEGLTETDLRKTAALMAAACAMGAAAAGAGQDTVGRAYAFGQDLGMAFQCRDDVLDGDGFAALLRAERCQAMAERYTNAALERLDGFEDTDFLRTLTGYLCGRTV